MHAIRNNAALYVVHSPTNTFFINLVKGFKFPLKYTIMSLLHVSAFNGHHHGVIYYIFIVIFMLKQSVKQRRYIN